MVSRLIHIHAKAATFILTFQLLLLHSLDAQEIKTYTETSNVSYELRLHYFSLGLDVATIDNLKGGFSLSYIHKVDKKEHHYLGLQFNGFPSNKSNSMNVTYYNYQTKNGEVKTDLAIVNFELVHYYFLSPKEVNSLFICSGIGINSIHNEINTSFYYYSGFPFGWLPNGDNASLDSNSISGKMEVGYWYNLRENKGFYAKIGFHYADSFNIINGTSSYYDSSGHLHFSTYNSNAISLQFGVGMLF